MRQVTWPVCEGCGIELKKLEDGVLFFGVIYPAGLEPVGPVLVQSCGSEDDVDAGQAWCFKCFDLILHPGTPKPEASPPLLGDCMGNMPGGLPPGMTVTVS